MNTTSKRFGIFLSLSLLLHGFNSTFAQTSHDSLLAVFEKTSPSLEQGMVLEELFLNKIYTDYDLSKSYLDKMLALGKEKKIDTLVHLHYLHLCTHYLITSKYDKADSISRILEPMIDTSKINALTQQHFMNRGNCYLVSSQFTKASEQYLKVKKICSTKGDSICIATVSTNIGSCLMNIGDFDKALEQFLPAHEYLMSVSESNYKLISLCNNIGKAYVKLDDRVNGEKYFLQSLSIAKKNDHVLNICESSSNLAVFYLEDDKLQEAKKYLDVSLPLAKEKKLWIQYINSLKTTGLYYLKSKNHKQSINYLDQALEVSLQKNAKRSIRSIYYNLYEAHAGNGEYEKAINYFKTSMELKDSLESVQKAKEIQELNIKYESAIKDAEITNQEIEIQNQKNTTKTITISSILLGLLGVSIFFFMRNKMLTAKKLADKDAEIKSQKITQLEKEKKILTMSSMIQGQEAERKRIAQDLHDGLGGLLASVKTKFGIIQNQIKALESLDVYKEANTMLDNACTEVRKIAHNMMPDALTKLGLVEAVKDTAVQYGEMKVEVIDLGMHPLDDTQEVMLYRVIQEFLNNTRKHAVASEVIIQFSTEGDEQLIFLEDNGGGFDKSALDNTKGMGLKSMESRINYIGGTLDIDSAIGVGTTMTIRIPKES